MHWIAGIANIILIDTEPDSFRNALALRAGIDRLSFDVDTLSERSIAFWLNFAFRHNMGRDQHFALSEPQGLL
jgi:hypothetical protein